MASAARTSWKLPHAATPPPGAATTAPMRTPSRTTDSLRPGNRSDTGPPLCVFRGQPGTRRQPASAREISGVSDVRQPLTLHYHKGTHRNIPVRRAGFAVGARQNADFAVLWGPMPDQLVLPRLDSESATTEQRCGPAPSMGGRAAFRAAVDCPSETVPAQNNPWPPGNSHDAGGLGRHTSFPPF